MYFLNVAHKDIGGVILWGGMKVGLIEKITCIQLDGQFPDLGYRFVLPDYGLPVIATILSEAGYDVKVYVEHIEPLNWDRIADSDLVCFSAFTSAAGKTRELAKEIRSRFDMPIVMGGTHATYFPETCLEFCDYVVLGEGDETIIDLVHTLSTGVDVDQVAGIAYCIGDRTRRTEPRSGPANFDTVPDFSLIEGYRRMGFLDFLCRRRVPLLTLQTSRGCPSSCTFCIVQTMFPDGYRKRSIDSVIRDLRDKYRYGKSLMFVDNEFSAKRRETKKLLTRMIEENLDFEISIFARVEISRDEELLSLMKQAGIYSVYLGFESIQPETLAGYKKRQSIGNIIASVEKLLAFGFAVSGSFVFGADSDTLDTVHTTAKFASDHKISKPHFFPIWGHYPERRYDYQSIVPWYRSIFRGWGYCDGLFVSNFPLQVPPSKLQQALIDAYRDAYSLKKMLQALRNGNLTDAKERLGIRYLWNPIEKGLREHVSFLEELEDGLYDADNRLKEEVLIERVRKDPKWTFQAGNKARESHGLLPLPLPIPEQRKVICAR